MLLRRKQNVIDLSLMGFDPLASYPPYSGMVIVSEEKKTSQRDLMLVLLTEMIALGASQIEVSKAVKHSMVVMDARTHNLDYVQSAIDNDIERLVSKYVKTTQEVLDSITN